MSANINKQDVSRQLDRIPEPPTPITERDVQAPKTLVRILSDIIRAVAVLSGQWRPKRIDFENRTVDDTGATKYRFKHGFDGPVRWWVVDWTVTIPSPIPLGFTYPMALSKDPSSDDNTLVLVSYKEGTVTIRVEEAG